MAQWIEVTPKGAGKVFGNDGRAEAGERVYAAADTADALIERGLAKKSSKPKSGKADEDDA